MKEFMGEQAGKLRIGGAQASLRQHDRVGTGMRHPLFLAPGGLHQQHPGGKGSIKLFQLPGQRRDDRADACPFLRGPRQHVFHGEIEKLALGHGALSFQPQHPVERPHAQDIIVHAAKNFPALLHRSKCDDAVRRDAGLRLRCTGGRQQRSREHAGQNCGEMAGKHRRILPQRTAAAQRRSRPPPGNGATIAPGCALPGSAGGAQTPTRQELSADALL
ncbi:MAG: hypothetical protein ACREVT_05035 [Burkholderiales bacterium]